MIKFRILVLSALYNINILTVPHCDASECWYVQHCDASECRYVRHCDASTSWDSALWHSACLHSACWRLYLWRRAGLRCCLFQRTLLMYVCKCMQTFKIDMRFDLTIFVVNFNFKAITGFEWTHTCLKDFNLNFKYQQLVIFVNYVEQMYWRIKILYPRSERTQLFRIMEGRTLGFHP
jgi:hypothetical protein